jgi:hypothetical protein
MEADQCEMFLLLCVLLYIYWNTKVWDEIDNKHLASRAALKENEPEVAAMEDKLILENALRHKYRTIAEYHRKYQVSASCAQTIVEIILQEGTKAQSK